MAKKSKIVEPSAAKEAGRKKWSGQRPETPDDIVECLTVFGSLMEISRRCPISYQAAQKLSQDAIKLGLMERLRPGHSREDLKRTGIERKYGGRVTETPTKTVPLPPKGKLNRFFFSCIQNDTAIFKPAFDNVLALLDYYGEDKRTNSVQLHIARITYIARGYGAMGNKDNIMPDKRCRIFRETMNYPEETTKYWSDEKLQLAPGLVWCGETNTIPTAARPLSGFESYTGRKSGIFPHTKVAMDSIASMPGEGTKFNYSTGALTVRNYIARKAGLKADFHHCYGGLFVEVDHKGDWWARQVVADHDGTIYDLDLMVSDGEVKTGGGFIDSIVWGDVHVAQGQADVFSLCWDKGGILDRLRPRRQFLHDVLDFFSRNHHEIKHPLKMFQRFVEGKDNVREEVEGVMKFMEHADRPDVDTVVVNSNHDRAMGRWLNAEDARFDVINVEFWALLWVAATKFVRDYNEQPNYLQLAFDLIGYSGDATILDQDQSYVVCEDESGGIECGAHGDDGPNGSRGSPLGFAKMGRKMVRAHSHIAGITDGVYTVGTNSTLRPSYSAGPSAWSHTFCVIYENGKRALVTIWDGKERA